MIYIISGIVSFFISILASSLGIGGSFLFIPLFTWLGLDYKLEVIPMVLLLNLTVSLTAQTSYQKKHLTETKVALIMAGVAIVFAQLGAIISRHMDAKSLMMIFAVLVTGVAIEIVFFNNYDEKDWMKPGAKVNIYALIVAGAFGGVMSGLIGIGGGFIIMPILLVTGFEPKRAAATSSLFVFFASASALVGHLKGQHVNLKIALICMVAVIIGAKIGAIIMTDKIEPATVKKVFGAVMLVIAIKIFVDTI